MLWTKIYEIILFYKSPAPFSWSLPTLDREVYILLISESIPEPRLCSRLIYSIVPRTRNVCPVYGAYPYYMPLLHALWNATQSPFYM